MTTIILDEKTFAEQALANNDLGTKPVETLSRVARYLYSEGYKKNNIRSLIEQFMIRCDPKINIVKWQSTIDRIANSADKYSLINIPGIAITQSELQKIKAIDGRLMQRLMFTMLCLAKYGNAVSENNNNWVNRKDREIFALANITLTIKRQSLMINDLWNMGYIGYSRVVDNINVNVRVIDDDSPIEIFVSDFRNLGNQYMRYCGEKYIECQCCGKVVRSGHGRQKYCTDCAAEVNRRKTAERHRSTLAS